VLLALGYGFLNCPKTVQSELFYTDLRNRAAQSHHTERFLPHRKARIGSPDCQLGLDRLSTGFPSWLQRHFSSSKKGERVFPLF
jgi:hypothetical protein